MVRKRVEFSVILCYQGTVMVEKNLEYSIFSGNVATLSDMPVQPLYRFLRSMPAEQAASFLPSLSREQRQLLLDIDLWEKDRLDIHHFEFWIKVYAQCGDEKILLNFAQSLSFQLYLKSRFNIYTFDMEDPQYPDHGNYFLTEDNLFLFEFHHDYPYVNEIKLFLLNLYSHLGVEGAYTFLFKTVAEHFSSFQECEYEDKKRRLGEQGFVDYYESLEMENCYPSVEVMNMAIDKISPVGLSGSYQSGTELLYFEDYIAGMRKDMERVGSEERKQYLRFSFVRLINAGLVFNGVFKSSDSAEWKKIGENISSLLSLGRSYLTERFVREEVLLNRFDFCQIYKVGNTLVKMAQKRLERTLSQFDVSESFRGNFWNNFLTNSLDSPCRFSGKIIGDMKTYREWVDGSEVFFGLVPFMKSLYGTWKQLLEEGQVQNSFYLNYTIEEIDFEVILISSFANHRLKSLRGSSRKMGLTLEEFRLFVKKTVDEKGKLRDLQEDGGSFLASYGLGHIPCVENYLMDCLRTHLEDVNYSILSSKDYKHLAGPIIFADTGILS